MKNNRNVRRVDTKVDWIYYFAIDISTLINNTIKLTKPNQTIDQ